MLIFNSLSNDLISLVIAFLVIIFGYFKWSYQYWRRKNLPFLEPQIPFGNVGELFASREHFAIKIKRLYDIMKERKWKHGGIYFFSTPVYMVIDLDYLKNIMAVDFQNFSDRGIYYNEKNDPLNANLFNFRGSKWRNLRNKLTPTFTPGKMKTMFQTLVECEANLQKKMDVEYRKNKPIDVKNILECFTTDVIGSCAFGIDCKMFEENSPFRQFVKKAFETSPLRRMKRSFALHFPTASRVLNLVLLPRDISDFFMKTVKKTVDYRQCNKITRNDFMQLLLDLEPDGTPLTIEEIAAQSFIFFVAGFETSSTTMAFALYELARNQHLQEKTRDEINSVLAKHDGKITYDSVSDMKYMNQVIDETLRKYPPGAVLSRSCVRNYKIPDTDIVLEKGTIVLIPVLGIHHDEDYYPDPEKFDPERFSEENKSWRHGYSHIPFGEGPRICIGMRFGLMQSKVGLTSLLKNFRFTVNSRTTEPLKMKHNSIVLAAKGEIWLDAQKM